MTPDNPASCLGSWHGGWGSGWAGSWRRCRVFLAFRAVAMDACHRAALQLSTVWQGGEDWEAHAGRKPLVPQHSTPSLRGKLCAGSRCSTPHSPPSTDPQKDCVPGLAPCVF